MKDPRDIEKAIKARIAGAIKRSGKTQREIAEALSVHASTVSGWASGDRLPLIGDLVLLAEFLGVGIEWLCLGEPEPPSHSNGNS